ncbi:MAG: hypothetical protein AAFY98_10955 [Verrucomicrobiota bacterium]
MLNIQWKPDQSTLRQFSLICLPGFGIISLICYFKFEITTLAIFFGILALALPVIGMVFPRSIRIVYVFLQIVAFPVGWVISHIVMALIYYGIFSLIGLFFRTSKRDLLGIRQHDQRHSYWKKKEQQKDVRSYYRMS